MQAPPISPETILYNRYRIVGAAGQGKLGQIYLARDQHRLNELCLLKEFSPLQQNPVALDAFWQYFQREMAGLQELQHSQIAPFYGIIACGSRFFTVRKYVEGSSYGVILDERNVRQTPFSEIEVTQLLVNALPVLTHLHSYGILHQNLCPHTIVQRQVDGLPVLINFAVVEQLLLKLPVQIKEVSPGLQLGGYAAPEQVAGESLSPSSDLYSLAVTAIVLLTGQEPEWLYNAKKQAFQWEETAIVHPQLAEILQKMLAPDPHHRYWSAMQVKQELAPLLEVLLQSQAPIGPLPSPLPVAPPPQPAIAAKRPISPLKPKSPPQDRDRVASMVLVTCVSLLVCVAAWKTLSSVQSVISPSNGTPTQSEPPSPEVSSPASPSADSSPLGDRRQRLDIPAPYFTALADDAFNNKHPDLQGRKLTLEDQDRELRQDWNAIANSLLDQLETLQPETRTKLGTYQQSDYDQWVSGDQAGLKEKLNIQANTRFYQMFPDLQGKELRRSTFGQIWYAIAQEEFQKLKGN